MGVFLSPSKQIPSLYVHDDPKAQTQQSHLPPILEGRKYYRPKSADEEKGEDCAEEEF